MIWAGATAISLLLIWVAWSDVRHAGKSDRVRMDRIEKSAERLEEIFRERG